MVSLSQKTLTCCGRSLQKALVDVDISDIEIVPMSKSKRTLILIQCFHAQETSKAGHGGLTLGSAQVTVFVARVTFEISDHFRCINNSLCGYRARKSPQTIEYAKSTSISLPPLLTPTTSRRINVDQLLVIQALVCSLGHVSSQCFKTWG